MLPAALGLAAFGRPAVSLLFERGRFDPADTSAVTWVLAAYAAGLDEIRESFLKPSPAWSSYYVNSTSHTYLGGNAYYNTNVQGTALTGWVGGVVNGAPASHVGP